MCSVLDAAIGGLPLQGITEIAGEAGCGKTQLCLTMSLQVNIVVLRIVHAHYSSQGLVFT